MASRGPDGEPTIVGMIQYEPWAIARDKELKAKLREKGLSAHSFNAASRDR